MNFHTEEWIRRQIERHYNEALKLYPEEQIVGIFLQGSQNYGMDYHTSDVDTKLILVPTLDDIALNKKPVSTTHILSNNEHIDAKDIRLMFQIFKKQNLNFIEILFTDYKILNPIYEELWLHFIAWNERISKANPLATLKTIKGIALEKYHALSHKYPSKIEIIENYGYDPKQLHHLARVYEFMKDFFVKEKTYKECLQGNEFVYSLKINTLDYSIAKALADQIKEELENLYQQFEANYSSSNKIDEEAYHIIDLYQTNFIKKGLINELS